MMRLAACLLLSLMLMSILSIAEGNKRPSYVSWPSTHSMNGYLSSRCKGKQRGAYFIQEASILDTSRKLDFVLPYKRAPGLQNSQGNISLNYFTLYNDMYNIHLKVGKNETGKFDLRAGKNGAAFYETEKLNESYFYFENLGGDLGRWISIAMAR